MNLTPEQMAALDKALAAVDAAKAALEAAQAARRESVQDYFARRSEVELATEARDLIRAEFDAKAALEAAQEAHRVLLMKALKGQL